MPIEPVRSLSVALVQARLSWRDPAGNRAHLEQQLERQRGPFELALLPETFTTGFLGDPDLPMEDMHGPTVEWMTTLAARYQCALAGSAVIVDKDHRYNRFLLATPDGAVRWYDKRHLFAFGGENLRYSGGQERVIWPFRGWRICPQVCYDLRFPVWCRNRDDYDLLLFVANWPGKRLAHWSALLRARAIENQAWVIGVNRVGQDGNGITYPGHSQVFDPLGEPLADLGEEETCQTVALDLERVAATRRQFPFQADADHFELLP